MHKLVFIFRADNTNVGDWWCPPFRTFKFRDFSVRDFADLSTPYQSDELIILGGGGLSSDFFKPAIDRLRAAACGPKIVWGAGVDSIVQSVGTLTEPSIDELYGQDYDDFDEVGLRVYSQPQRHRYVPCSSCMNELFTQYRETKPTHLIGFYSHKRVNLLQNNTNVAYLHNNNDGADLAAKLKYLASLEYVVTNSFHGVYWATLLARKVIVVPYKSGLYSVKHKPVYLTDGEINDELLHQAKSYPDALEDSRQHNISYYEYLTNKYNLV